MIIPEVPAGPVQVVVTRYEDPGRQQPVGYATALENITPAVFGQYLGGEAVTFSAPENAIPATVAFNPKEHRWDFNFGTTIARTSGNDKLVIWVKYFFHPSRKTRTWLLVQDNSD